MKIIICTMDENPGKIKCHELNFQDGNPEEWRGVTVYGEFTSDEHSAELSPAACALLGQARQTASESDDKAQLLLIGNGHVETARNYFSFVDRVFVYDDPELSDFDAPHCTAVSLHFIKNYKPAAVYIRNTKPMQPVIDAVLRGTGEYLESQAEISDYELDRMIPEADPDHRGELVICEIPEF